jgi:uncharacterized protein (DUF1501 family)
MKKISRRDFIGQASCAAVGSTAMLSSLLNLKLTGLLAAQNQPSTTDYKALVCLFLAGGNDSFNMVVPRDSASYSDYRSIRADLALSSDQLLAMNHSDVPGKQYGLHPSLTGMQTLHNQGDLAFVYNVGTLLEPTDLASIESGLARLPLGLYSHADQIAHWQTSMPDRRTAIGWGGRMADMMQDLNSQQSVSMNISLSGNNLFQAGNQVISFSLSPNADDRPGIDGYGDTEDYFSNLKTQIIDQLMAEQYEHLLEKSYAGSVRNSIEASELVANALDQAPTLQTQFSSNEVSQSFRAVASMISVRHILGMQRQTFFVQFGGGIITMKCSIASPPCFRWWTMRFGNLMPLCENWECMTTSRLFRLRISEEH